MKKGLGIATIAILLLGVLAAIPIVLPKAHAGTLGTITVSSDRFSGDNLLQITITDPDIAAATAGMPSVEVNGVAIDLYQIVGGAWVAWIVDDAFDTPTNEGRPANPPNQEANLGANEPNADDDGDGVTELGEFDEVVEEFDFADAGVTSVTIIYHDVDPFQDVSVTVSYGAITGAVTLDREEYPLGATVNIDVEDVDLNADPTAAETTAALLNLATTTGGAVGVQTMTETGPTTGVFEDAIALPAGTAVGDIITVTYDAGGDNVVVTAVVTANTGAVTLDKAEYDINDVATITLTDPDLNLNAEAADEVNNVNVLKVTVDLPAAVGNYAVDMDETGVNTGVFTGQFSFVLDDGDANDDSTAGNDPIIEVASGATITVTYTDANTADGRTNVDLTATADFVTHTGTVALDRDTYGPNAVATVTVTDMDLNTDSSARERYYSLNVLDVTSAADQNAPHAIMILETGPDTGVFTGQFRFTTTDGAGTAGTIPTVEVAIGGTVTVTYTDAVDAAGNAVDVTDTATFRSQTGSIDILKSVISPDTTILVQLTDPDLNTDAYVVDDAFDSLADTALTFYSTSWPLTSGTEDEHQFEDSAAVETDFDETGVNTGVFEIRIDLSHATVLEAAGDTFYVKYIDPANSAGGTSTLQDTASVRTNTGTLSLDKSEYSIGDTITITLTDPDLNTDPEAADTTPDDGDDTLEDSEVLIKSSTDPTGEVIVLTETGWDTNVFTDTIIVSETQATNDEYLLVSRADTVTVQYRDAATAGGGGAITITATATITATTGTLELDKTVYTPRGKVTVTVTDPDLNVNSLVNDELDETTERARAFTTSDPTGIYFTLTETGPDTGVFQAIITLAAATNDAADELKAADDDGLTVVYIDAADAAGNLDVAVRKTALVTYNTGILSFDMASYTMDDSPVVTLNDPDLNLEPALRESANIAITSSTDPAGIRLTLTETAVDSGVFSESFTFTTGTSQGTKLQAAVGDIITAVYDDAANADGLAQRIKATATLTVTPVAPGVVISAGAPSLLDVNGNPIAAATVGTTVLLSTEMTNSAAEDQAMLYIVQVKDAAGRVVSLSFISGTVPAGATYTFGVPWIPAEAGDYTVEVFAWHSWTDPTPLSEVSTATVTATS
ncbi:hypothetical protein [Candidatus Hecatella orcuttiae]|uniref:hypothetical protein n=1 Tax=Candidatus Hecatella orcuttiae TaxID=1935119 RepID=UPI002867DB0B|nr:hypothetical protein [Candidatus Hecatella orcuttiae]